MIHIPCVQGSEAWLRHRMGKPTASEFDKIITPAKREDKNGNILGWQPTKGETRRNYQVHLLTELILDMPLSNVTTGAMEHGHDWEPKARAAYEMLLGVDAEPCGFCTNDEGTIGASPDGFVGDEGTVEFKSPQKPEIHVGYLLNPQSLVDEYFVQTQGQLLVADTFQWTDLVSYFDGLPMVRVRVTREEEFQSRLKSGLKSFVCELSDLITRAIENGWIEKKKAPKTADWITQADLDAILEARKVAL